MTILCLEKLWNLIKKRQIGLKKLKSESCQKWHDIVQKDMQPLFDRNRKIVLEKMKRESEQNNKTKE